MIRDRKRTAAFAAILIGLAGIGVNAAMPAQAQPSVDTVQKKVDALYQQAEQASERANLARVDLSASHAQLSGLNADLARQQAIVTKMRQQVATMVVDQYQGQALSTASQVMLSSDPNAFLDNLNAVSSYNDQRGQTMSQYATQLERLKLRQGAVKAEAAQLSTTQKLLIKDKAQLEVKAAAAKAILDKLKTAQLAQIMTGTYTGPLPSVPASGRAAAALHYALAQVGKAYVWGAAGPNAFDCSGLMMAAWAQAGVSLPHSSSAQQGSGVHVSESDLQPGDLVFYYSPVSHVAMYIGNGLVVNAENPSVGVTVVPVNTFPYSGAVRIG